jgi:DNA (cytosine-5)-methyltransferase 1
MRILNAYCGIGGNRKYWDKEHTGQDVEVVAVERHPQIAKIYSDFFPQDRVIIGDAHSYLLEHFAEYDFIWSSPPCPTHSKIRRYSAPMQRGQIKPVYPDMKLYEEILLLMHYFEGKYCVENVVAFYEPLIPPQELQRHYFWSNFHITQKEFPTEKTCSVKDRERLSALFGFNLDKYTGLDGVDKRTLLRNCVLPELGLHILNESKRNIQPELFK